MYSHITVLYTLYIVYVQKDWMNELINKILK